MVGPKGQLQSQAVMPPISTAKPEIPTSQTEPIGSAPRNDVKMSYYPRIIKTAPSRLPLLIILLAFGIVSFCFAAADRLLLPQTPPQAKVKIAYRMDSPLLQFGAKKIQKALEAVGSSMEPGALGQDSQSLDIAVISNPGERDFLRGGNKPVGWKAHLGPEGFQIIRVPRPGRALLCVRGGDETGAMYGMLDLAEQVQMRGSLAGVREKISKPRFPFRACKFNLPWAPYRPAPSTELHYETCRDLKFWSAFLDMLAENRFNVLSLWNLHPFPYMFRPKNFPEACPLSDAELKQWQEFWHSLFRMAQDRGIQPYILDWNIYLSPAFAKAHHLKEENDLSELAKRYNRECVTQLIDDYPELAGFGVALGDPMEHLDSKEREQWITDTAIAGIKAAKRPIRFIHRAPFGDQGSRAADMRSTLDAAGLPPTTLVEIKFNWSHGHSTPTLAMTHGLPVEGFIKPKPKNYRIVWTVRNEDFFILRWGQPDFIRRHIAENGKDYVEGYFIGSEGYIPALDYSHIDSTHKTWNYAFEKQWLFYQLWGRLLYDPQTPDAVFENAFNQRYGPGVGKEMLEATQLAGRMPLRLASFHSSTWDYTLYSEGFADYAKVSEKTPSAFIGLEDFIGDKTLDPSYVSIPDFVGPKGTSTQKGRVTPLELADESEADGLKALELA